MRKGFTLVELLAVIVILAVILVIAVPRITDTIVSSKKSALESSTKLVASTLERDYQSALVSESTFATSGSCASYVDSNEYGSCTYTITDGVATVTLKGKSGGKFDKLKSTGTKVSATTSEMTMITFTLSFVNNGTYTVEQGTTWADWINATATGTNTNGIVDMSSYYIRIFTGGDFMTTSSGNYVLKTDVITAQTYSFEECCFDAGTQILMADGTTKNIEDVEVGDMVMSLNEDTGEYVTQKVQKTIINHHSSDLVYVNLSDGTRIGMRAYHPLLTTEGYKSLRPESAMTIKDLGKVVEELKVGDTLVGYNGNATIVSIEERAAIENYDTYNLYIEGYHNYIANGYVAHNASC